jgi:GcrA cell cycle regulator
VEAAAPVVPVPRTAPPVALVPARPAPRGSRLVACCWPIGEPGTSGFHFCDDEALAGKPYCARHATLAYVKVRDRREDAA